MRQPRGSEANEKSSKNSATIKVMKSVIITGSLAFDYIMDYPHTFEADILPEKLKALSVSFQVQNLNKNFGGVAGNIAYNLSLLGQASAIVASAGAYDFSEYQKHLQGAGIKTDSISLVKKEFTANAFIITDKNNCQITGFYPGALSHDKFLSFPSYQNIDFVIIGPTETDAMVGFVKEAQKRHLPYLYYPVQHIPQLTGEQLTEAIFGAEILIGNDYEIALIMKKTKLSKKELLAKTKILVTTLGAKGSFVETKKEAIAISIAKPKAIVDPTGAGDAYIAGFVNGYLNSLSLLTCGQMGATVAAFAIENYGTQNHKFSAFDFQKRYQQTFGKVIQ